MATMQPFLLPSNVLLTCQDPLGLVSVDEHHVPFWDVLKAILSYEVRDSSSLLAALEDIAYTLNSSKSREFSFLQDFLETNIASKDDFFTSTWPKIVTLALEMPELFPPSTIIPLSISAEPHKIFSRRQIACLFIHQFLGTFQSPPWASRRPSWATVGDDTIVNFRIWYYDNQLHPGACRAYLTALFTYFKRLSFDSHNTTLDVDWSISFRLLNFNGFPEDDNQIPLVPLELCRIGQQSTHPDYLGVPHGACVVSANKVVGFGRTGTQEEVHVGASPESCVISLFAPPLQDNEVLVVEGVEAIVEIVAMGGELSLGKY